MALLLTPGSPAEDFLKTTMASIDQLLLNAKLLVSHPNLNIGEIKTQFMQIEDAKSFLEECLSDPDNLLPSYLDPIKQKSEEIQNTLTIKVTELVEKEMQLAEKSAAAETWDGQFQGHIINATAQAKSIDKTLENLGYDDQKINTIVADGCWNGILGFEKVFRGALERYHEADDFVDDYSKIRADIRKSIPEVFSYIQSYATDLNRIGKGLNEVAQKEERDFSDLGDITAAKILGPKRTAALLQAAEAMRINIADIRWKLTQPQNGVWFEL